MTYPIPGPDFQQQASRAFGRLVRSINDAQLRALMRAIFYRGGRYQSFCQAPLAASGPDSACGSAVRHAIRTGRLVRSVAGSFSASSRDLMLACALLLPAGATEAFDLQERVRLTARGRLYPVAVLSTLLVHDATCTLDPAKRALLEGLMLQSAWQAGSPGVPAPEESGFDGPLQHEAQVVALCIQLDRLAGDQPAAARRSATVLAPNVATVPVKLAASVAGAVRWSSSEPAAPDPGGQGGSPSRSGNARLTLVRSSRKEADESATEPRSAAG